MIHFLRLILPLVALVAAFPARAEVVIRPVPESHLEAHFVQPGGAPFDRLFEPEHLGDAALVEFKDRCRRHGIRLACDVVPNHTGIDFAGKSGAEVIAVADGVVTWSSTRYGYGLMVEINHGNGYTTRYAHNSENLVAVGDEVKKGQIVALMGETGRATGPNLHFEVLQNGRRVNPVKFIRESSN